MKQVNGYSLLIGQGKELTQPIRYELWRQERPILPESYYVVSVDSRGTCIIGGPYLTEERADGDIWAITDTSGT